MKYVKFTVLRLLTMIPIMLVVSIIVFFLLRMSGSDPVTILLGTKQSTPEVVAALREQYHLNDPLLLQYFRWIQGILRGDLGTDYVYRQSISALILTRIPVTLGLVIISSATGIFAAIILGVVSALNRNGPIDKGLSVLMLTLSSSPSFVVSILVLIVLSKSGISFVGALHSIHDYFSRIIIPSLVMSLHMVAMLGRITRTSMITQMQSPYITTAIAKGISDNAVTFKHAFHNAVIPVLTIAGLMTASSVGGTVLIEQIFSLPGIGGLLVEGIQMGNYPIVQILVLFMLSVYLFMSFVVDLMYNIVDPRVAKKA
jgi:peptide/nickel transport system permease protein